MVFMENGNHLLANASSYQNKTESMLIKLHFLSQNMKNTTTNRSSGSHSTFDTQELSVMTLIDSIIDIMKITIHELNHNYLYSDRIHDENDNVISKFSRDIDGVYKRVDKNSLIYKSMNGVYPHYDRMKLDRSIVPDKFNIVMSVLTNPRCAKDVDSEIENIGIEEISIAVKNAVYGGYCNLASLKHAISDKDHDEKYDKSVEDSINILIRRAKDLSTTTTYSISYITTCLTSQVKQILEVISKLKIILANNFFDKMVIASIYSIITRYLLIADMAIIEISHLKASMQIDRYYQHTKCVMLMYEIMKGVE